MKEAANYCQMRAEFLAQEAVEAQRAAKQALERLAEITMTPQQGQNTNNNPIVSSDNGSEDVDSEESNNEETNSEEIDIEESNNNEINMEENSCEKSDDEASGSN